MDQPCAPICAVSAFRRAQCSTRGFLAARIRSPDFQGFPPAVPEVQQLVVRWPCSTKPSQKNHSSGGHAELCGSRWHGRGLPRNFAPLWEVKFVSTRHYCLRYEPGQVCVFVVFLDAFRSLCRVCVLKIRANQFPFVLTSAEFAKLFPKRLLDDQSLISTIKLNGVTTANVQKALDRILSAERKQGKIASLEKTQLQQIAERCEGDIRNAINSLQLLCLSILNGKLPPDAPGPVKRKRFPAVDDSFDQGFHEFAPQDADAVAEELDAMRLGAKDSTLFAFHALGKVLRAKRDGSQARTPAFPLRVQLRCHARAPLQLGAEPEAIVESCDMAEDRFVAFLHENYPAHFSDLDDVGRAAAYLSDADLLTSKWQSREQMAVYGASVSVRGLLHANEHRADSKFRPVVKPQLTDIINTARENAERLRHLLTSGSEINSMAPLAWHTEYAPFTLKIRRNDATFTPAHRAAMQAVGQFNQRTFGRRLVTFSSATDLSGGDPTEEQEGDTASGAPGSRSQLSAIPELRSEAPDEIADVGLTDTIGEDDWDTAPADTQQHTQASAGRAVVEDDIEDWSD
eukprot:m.474445 g.474445  ORF g.474445 m.474445 type:complete len:571 (+) comp57134_c0_seq2:663-2375(+)